MLDLSHDRDSVNGERDRDREKERERDRHTDRKTDRQRAREYTSNQFWYPFLLYG